MHWWIPRCAAGSPKKASAGTSGSGSIARCQNGWKRLEDGGLQLPRRSRDEIRILFAFDCIYGWFLHVWEENPLNSESEMFNIIHPTHWEFHIVVEHHPGKSQIIQQWAHVPYVEENQRLEPIQWIIVPWNHEIPVLSGNFTLPLNIAIEIVNFPNKHGGFP